MDMRNQPRHHVMKALNAVEKLFQMNIVGCGGKHGRPYLARAHSRVTPRGARTSHNIGRTMRTAILTLTLATAVAFADKANPTEPEIQNIIKRFAEKEAEFAKARENYTYRQTALVRE